MQINKCCWSFVNKLHQVWSISPKRVLSTETWQLGTFWCLEITYVRLATVLPVTQSNPSLGLNFQYFGGLCDQLGNNASNECTASDASPSSSNLNVYFYGLFFLKKWYFFCYEVYFMRLITISCAPRLAGLIVHIIVAQTRKIKLKLLCYRVHSSNAWAALLL